MGQKQEYRIAHLPHLVDRVSRAFTPAALVVRESDAPALPEGVGVFELSVRRVQQPGAGESGPLQVSSSAQLIERFGPYLAELTKEEFWAAYLDGKNRIIGSHLISRGTLTSSMVHPREVFRPAVALGADRLIVLHNHPSGDPQPSPEDMEITRRLLEAGELLGIELLDHIIVPAGGVDRAISFRERGDIP